MGCQVPHVRRREDLVTALEDCEGQVVFLDAASLGDAGPEWAG